MHFFMASHIKAKDEERMQQFHNDNSLTVKSTLFKTNPMHWAFRESRGVFIRLPIFGKHFEASLVTIGLLHSRMSWHNKTKSLWSSQKWNCWIGFVITQMCFAIYEAFMTWSIIHLLFLFLPILIPVHQILNNRMIVLSQSPNYETSFISNCVFSCCNQP